jgi:outer membrane protein TolC
MFRFGFWFLCLLVLLISGNVYANEIKPDKSDAYSNGLRLSLKMVVQKTIKNNVEISVQQYFSKINEQSITEAESVFDPKLEGQVSTSDRADQVSSAFASPDITENEDQKWELSLTQKLKTGADYSLNFTNQRNKTNSLFAGLNPQYNSDLFLSLNQPLFKNFGQDINEKDIYIASNNKTISDFDFKTKVLDVLANVENTYWDLVFSIEDLKVKEKSLERAKDLERRVKAQVAVGSLAPLETLQAQAEVASREQLLLNSQNVIQDNQDKVKNSMTVNFNSPLGNADIVPVDRPTFKSKIEMPLNEAINLALLNRPDYLAKKKDLENKNIQVKFDENQLYPSLDLFGTFGLNGLSGDARTISNFDGSTSQSRFNGGYGESLDNLADTDFFNWEVGLKLSYPLGNRSAKSKLNASRLKTHQAILDIKNLERSIIVEVREAVRQIETDIKRVKAAKIARKLGEEKLAAEEKKFEVGLSTSFNVLEFQEDLAENQSQEIQAIIDYKKSKIKLNRVIGKTLEEYGVKVLASK